MSWRTPTNITLVVDAPDGSGEDLLAFAQVRRHSPPDGVTGEVELLRFYVDRPAHGSGLAHQLMETVLDAARELGGRALWLGVWERNPRAMAFYRKCRFRDAGSHQFVVGTDSQTDRIMVKQLTEG
ncbi:MAG: GNAT family N-acetyltransferase [Acidobacteriota bacterium]